MANGRRGSHGKAKSSAPANSTQQDARETSNPAEHDERRERSVPPLTAPTSQPRHDANLTAPRYATLAETNLLSEINRLKEQLEAEKRAREAAEKRASETAAAAGRRASNASHEPVLKPKGSAGQGICLIEVMGLQDDVEQYNTILRDVRDLVHSAQLDWTVDYREQPMADLGNLFAVARQRHPILARFKNDWVTSEIVKQFMRNRRKFAYRKGVLHPTTKHNRVRSSRNTGASSGTDTNSGLSNQNRRVIGHVEPAQDDGDVHAAAPAAAEKTRPRPRKRRRVHDTEEAPEQGRDAEQ
ncbi:hypothetical protein GLOTRDRAFT_111248 [Gloeophyllum trabeum ATCC 11539]|uniref:Uncharacterized protein n=1 Tax=Gloeophyllum trabeum (strain ATCC 11539 / FP-39264 / Madison 617) TaxID=670483 RepID=S7Q4J3_GLOTA|nr:uncharacterized protein GLOTRDRAFT_111248 [Gloeophyllum trabeum ATCC 11539]EPQ54398.1 hypothetical protein GLOTRDRAFT_111248 [Gloeophyllum trabeum ATCC 11539]